MKNTVKTAQSAHGMSSNSVQDPPACEGSCSRTFAQAGKDRASYPLKSGAYKLREARSVLEEQIETLEAIESIVVSNSRPHPEELLGCCVAGERSTWLKSLPDAMARALGYYIVPAVGALAGDGVSAGGVSRMLDHARSECMRLVAACDEVAALMDASSEEMDFAMRRSGSLIKALLLDAIALVDAALPHPLKY